MAQIEYWTSSMLWLSLEKLYNRGLSPARAGEIIRAIPDPGSATMNLRCSSSGLNNNWRIETQANDPDAHAQIVSLVEAALLDELRERDRTIARRPST